MRHQSCLVYLGEIEFHHLSVHFQRRLAGDKARNALKVLADAKRAAQRRAQLDRYLRAGESLEIGRLGQRPVEPGEDTSRRS